MKNIQIISIHEWNEDRIELISLGDYQWEIKEVELFQNYLVEKVTFSEYEMKMIYKHGFDYLYNMLGLEFKNEVNALIECYGVDQFLEFATRLN